MSGSFAFFSQGRDGLFKVCGCVFGQVERVVQLTGLAVGAFRSHTYSLHRGLSCDDSVGGCFFETPGNFGSGVGLPALFFLEDAEGGADNFGCGTVTAGGDGVSYELLEFGG
jgi:hypothetical protein